MNFVNTGIQAQIKDVLNLNILIWKYKKRAYNTIS